MDDSERQEVEIATLDRDRRRRASQQDAILGNIVLVAMVALVPLLVLYTVLDYHQSSDWFWRIVVLSLMGTATAAWAYDRWR